MTMSTCRRRRRCSLVYCCYVFTAALRCDAAVHPHVIYTSPKAVGYVSYQNLVFQGQGLQKCRLHEPQDFVIIVAHLFT